MGEKMFLHRLHLDGREKCSLTGVIDVISFEEERTLIRTDCGVLEVKGHELHMDHLSLEEGELRFHGIVYSCIYSDNDSYEKPAKSILKRIFR